jgi:MOSC domain-containing protein YiiM
MGKLIEIATHNEKGADMVICASTRISPEYGVGDDYRGVIRDDRQVSVLTLENWNESCKELGKKLHWTTRRANILVGDIELANSTGMILKIGEAFLEITGELKAGRGMDKQIEGLSKVLKPNWRGGVRCKVLQGGVINEGDEVLLGERT